MILSADLGTSSLKAALINAQGSAEALVRIPYRPSQGGQWENFDPFQWEEAFHKALKALPSQKISALALSGNGPTLVPCDAGGLPVAPADLWVQNRSIRLAGQQSYYLPKAAWLKAHNQEIWEKISLFLSCPEWLQFRLTGKASMTLPNANFRPYLWDSEQVAYYGFEPTLFPEMFPMGQIAGYINAEKAATTGLPLALPVVAVGSDFMASLLGSGAIKPGLVCDRAGTSEAINYCSEKPSKSRSLRDLPHVVEPYWNVAAILSSSGAVLEWYRRLIGLTTFSYNRLFGEIMTLPAGQKKPLFFPGNQEAMSREFGGGVFHDLEPQHGRVEMGRAVVEALGFAVRRGVEQLEEAGLPVTEMRLSGGQAQGSLWNQMKADITGRRLAIPEIEDAELTGGACCALAALGQYDNPVEASKNLVRIREIVEPNEKMRKIYDETYAYYQETSAYLIAPSLDDIEN